MSKLQDLFKKYGKIGIGVHLSIYAAPLAGACMPKAQSRSYNIGGLTAHGCMSTIRHLDNVVCRLLSCCRKQAQG